MPKLPRDPNQRGKMIVDISVGEIEDTELAKKKHPAAQRAGGLAGGKSRANKPHDLKRVSVSRRYWRSSRTRD